jgi:hypothetical protein
MKDEGTGLKELSTECNRRREVQRRGPESGKGSVLEEQKVGQ